MNGEQEITSGSKARNGLRRLNLEFRARRISSYCHPTLSERELMVITLEIRIMYGSLRRCSFGDSKAKAYYTNLVNFRRAETIITYLN
jgi:hypothetical protein